MLCNSLGLITLFVLGVATTIESIGGHYVESIVFRERVEAQKFSSKLTCVPITQCPSILGLLKKKPVSPHSLKLIRTSSCGFDGHIEKVWCPKIQPTTTTTTEEPTTITTTEITPNTTESPITTTDAEGLTTVDTQSPTIITTTEESSTTIEIIKVTENSGIDNVTIHIQTKNPFPIDKCNNGIGFKVMGGTSTEIDDYPWMAILQYENSRTKNLYNGCAGALLSERYVLTAAHCITTRTAPVNIVLGEYDTKTEIDCVSLPGGEEDCAPPLINSAIEKIHVHPEWLVEDRRPFYNDIALIRLASSIAFSDFVKPICLPSPEIKRPIAEDLVVAGWGRTEHQKPSNMKLQLVIPTVPNSDCSKAHGKHIVKSQICAGGVAGKDTCIGDSGGPLMSFDMNMGIWQVIGIVSLSSRGCGIEGIPGIYTYVPNYITWINSVVSRYKL